jgi:O-acetyl-ADP-ribose deacetylase (regulator of RNase III)
MAKSDLPDLFAVAEAQTMTAARFKQLYYITHVDNLPSIMQHGILSHAEIERRGIPYVSVYDEAIVQARKQRLAPDGNSLWNFANLYLRPKNAMLYRLKVGHHLDELVILGVRRGVANLPGAYISDGGLGSPLSQLHPSSSWKEVFQQLLPDLDREWWAEGDGSKRRMMAECLIPHGVDPEYLETIYTHNRECAEAVQSIAVTGSLEVVPEASLFFEPVPRKRITEKLVLLTGDMFFSRLQTVTVSVNCVGVMGKGLASRAKYQFPDVYVQYQDVCRSKRLVMGVPYLYQRESSLDDQLADEPQSLTHANGHTWFLLFPTKNHWRDRADLNGIREGMEWLKVNGPRLGIAQIAMPALGCGLGKLRWTDVGPVMCSTLHEMNIPAHVYLPAEQQIADFHVTPEFLLQGAR